MLAIRKSTNKRKPRGQGSRSSKRRAYAKSTYYTSGTNPQNAVVFRGMGFPDRLTTNLIYADSIILDPSATTVCPFVVYNLTSLFDPQFAIGGGQPTYFDQLATVYSRYSVNGAKITCTFSRSTTTAANVGPYLCGIQTSDLSSLPATSPGLLMSTPNCVTRLVSQEDGSSKLTQTYSKKNTYPDFTDGLQARVNANPLIGWYAKIFATPQGVDIEQPINVSIIIEYNATFSDVLQVVDA